MTTKTCEFCGVRLIRDTHYCAKMQKLDFLDSPIGKIAFMYYKEWLKAGGFHQAPTHETFLNSRYFSSFIRFIQFSNAMWLPDPVSYMRYVMKLKLLPTHWSNDDVYVNYISHLDKNYPPAKQAEDTKRTLHELASMFGCQVSEVFDHLKPGDAIMLLRARKLTPWVVLLSKRFSEYLQNKWSREQRDRVIDTVINPTQWKQKFLENPDDVKAMKQLVSELGI
jgi:hypothetical protein